MIVEWLSAVVVVILAAVVQPVIAQPLDPYGGYTALPSPNGATGYFRTEKFGNRWLFVTPDGNAFWLAGVFNMDNLGSIPDQGVSYDQIVAQKYPDKPTWANQMAKRISSWGFNTVAEYATAYVYPFGRPAGARLLPMANTIRPSWYGLTNNGGYAPGPFKALEDCVDRNVYTNYVGDGPPDVFDPNFDAYVNGLLRATAADPYWSQWLTSPWMIGLATDDVDQLQGFGPGLQMPGSNGYVTVHIGWLALSVSPTKASSSRYGVTYANPTVYTKKALHDFLATKYGNISALNAAWGSSYTTFDSSGGWGTGTGLMDENGRHTTWLGTTEGTLAGATAGVVADLDDFLFQYASKYFGVTAGRIRQYAPTHLVFGPSTLNGWGGLTRAPILRAAGRFLDVIQAGVTDHQLLDLTVQAAGDKPLITWEGMPANPQSSLWRYPNPGFGVGNQADRGAWYAGRVNMLLNSHSTSTGVYAIAGFKFWSWSDSWGEKTNWGLVSFRDNAYDAKEAIVAAGVDPWGYTTGGEELNYGDFIGAVTAANGQIPATVIGGTSPPPPVVATVAFSSPTNGSTVQGSVNVSASTNAAASSVRLYLDGGMVMATTGSAASYVWDTKTTPNGKHSWTATAYDTNGVPLATSTITTTVNNSVDTTAPVVTITWPSGYVTRRSSVTLTATAKDDVGVVKVEFYVNGTLQCTDTGSPYNCSWRVPGALGKSYNLRAKAYDAAGNIGVSTIVTVTATQ